MVALKIKNLSTIALMKTTSLVATGRGGEDQNGSYYPKDSSAQHYDDLTVPGHTHTHTELVFISPDSELTSWKQLFPKGVCQKQPAANI